VSVLVAGHETLLAAHRAHVGGTGIAPTVLDVRAPIALRQQQLDRLSHHLCARVPEHHAGADIELDDPSGAIHNDDRVG
jgi:hypothetical protein